MVSRLTCAFVARKEIDLEDSAHVIMKSQKKY